MSSSVFPCSPIADVPSLSHIAILDIPHSYVHNFVYHIGNINLVSNHIPILGSEFSPRAFPGHQNITGGSRRPQKSQDHFRRPPESHRNFNAISGVPQKSAGDFRCPPKFHRNRPAISEMPQAVSGVPTGGSRRPPKPHRRCPASPKGIGTNVGKSEVQRWEKTW